MNTQQQMSLDQMGQSLKDTPLSESFKSLENRKLSTFSTRKIKDTPFTMVSDKGRVMLTISGMVTCEKTWKTFRRCERWTRKRLAIFQIATGLFEKITELQNGNNRKD